MKLNKVTLTGVDKWTDADELVAITKEYPFVEWGVLLSRSSAGKSPRFPSIKVIEGIYEIFCSEELKPFAGHLCGKWVTELAMGDFTFVKECPTILDLFERIQINFHGEQHQFNIEKLYNSLIEYPYQYIFQIDDVNNHIFEALNFDGDHPRDKFVTLFDKSHGYGVVPDSWPKPYIQKVEGTVGQWQRKDGEKVLAVPHAYHTVYSGYAGGLSPDNVEQEIEKIAERAENAKVWIDMETHIRTDEKLDLDKCVRVLEKCKKHIEV